MKIASHKQPLALIYRTPYSKNHQFSTNSFIKECPDLIKTLLNNTHTQTIMLGDFNIPWNKEDCIDTKLMHDALNVFDLFQNVSLQTHKVGNILDWILAVNELHKENLIPDIANKDFLSDHCIIKFKAALPRPHKERIS